MTAKPYLFDEFFSSGLEESVSPFLTHSSRRWGKNLSLKSASIAAIFLLLAFFSSFWSAPLSYLCLSFTFFLAGAPALIQSIEDFKNFEINIDVLMTLAAFAAVGLGSGLEGALLLVLFEFSGALEETVSHKAFSALHNLNHLAPKFAHVVLPNGTSSQKSVREIQAGVHLLIKAGEIVPLDGIVISGTSSVNLVHLTGEALPNLKQPGDEVPAGARNLDAAFTLKVTRTSSDSTLAKIITLIAQAQEGKPKLQRVLDRFGKRYAPTIIALTAFFALTLPLFLAIPYLGPEGSIYRALAFLIAASPCALIIATPTAYLSAISACARRGILLKGGNTLDALASCSRIAFDKTGTLTTGQLQCMGIEPLETLSYTEQELIAIAASLERQVVHPIATAIVHLAQERQIPFVSIDQFKTIPGFALEGLLTSTKIPIAIGLPEYIAKKLVPAKEKSLELWIEKNSSPGEILTALLVKEDVFFFRFQDQIRETAPKLIRELETVNHLKSMILTGDNFTNAKAIGDLLGLHQILANLRPQDKLQAVSEISEKEHLAMIGDGVNDAPALARATVGISMGRIGSATAVDASDVILLNDDLHLLSWLFSKSHSTRQIVKQNLALSLSVICLATTPALLGWVPLWIAVILHEGGAVLVGINSLRLLR